MRLTGFPDALAWCDDTSLDDVRATYHDRLDRALALRLQETRETALDQADSLETRFAGLDEASRRRWITAPEISRRLLWKSTDREETLACFCSALLAESARAGHYPPEGLRERVWTPLGDAWFGPGSEQGAWPAVAGLGPLDFGSPFAARVDLSGAGEVAPAPRPPFTESEVTGIVERFATAAAGIAAASDSAARFAAIFNAVLILQKDPDFPATFASGSNGQHIGRSFLTNPEREHATPEAISDAIIHEGIHAVLYMDQLETPWGPSEVIYDPSPRIASSWTGRRLPVRSFLEACFVWYGLLHFWCMAMESPFFQKERVVRFLRRALEGFLKAPLADLVRAAAPPDAVCPVLLGTVETLQARVSAAFAG